MKKGLILLIFNYKDLINIIIHLYLANIVLFFIILDFFIPKFIFLYHLILDFHSKKNYFLLYSLLLIKYNFFLDKYHPPQGR